MTPELSLVKRVHLLVSNVLIPGAIVIDATVGNGHDTMFLAKQVGHTGQVYGFDIQQAAIDKTLEKFRQTALPYPQLIKASHAEMTKHIPIHEHGRISAVLFNLGYLPGSDQQVITQANSTINALISATRILEKNGIITIIAYPGHPGGDIETEQVSHWCTQLNPIEFCVAHFPEIIHKVSAPRLFVISKVG